MNQIKLSVSSIKMYPSNMVVWDTLGNSHSINLDGQLGEFTRAEWSDDPTIVLFDNEGQERILSTLDTLEVFSEE